MGWLDRLFGPPLRLADCRPAVVGAMNQIVQRGPTTSLRIQVGSRWILFMSGQNAVSAAAFTRPGSAAEVTALSHLGFSRSDSDLLTRQVVATSPARLCEMVADLALDVARRVWNEPATQSVKVEAQRLADQG